MRALVFAACGLAAVAQAAPVVFGGSPVIAPGSVVQVQGSGFDGRCRLELTPRGIPGAGTVQRDPIEASATALHVVLPAVPQPPLWSVVVDCDGARSAPWLLGSLRVAFSPVAEVAPGDGFDLYGHFGAPHFTLRAWLERRSSGERIALDVSARSAHRVRLTLPETLPADDYALLLDHSADGSGLLRVPVDAHPRIVQRPPGAVDAAALLEVPEARPLFAHVRSVGVVPATGLVADGLTDNRPRLQQLIDQHAPQSIDRIVVIDVPAGRYALDVVGPGRALRLARGVLVRGAPQSATELVFGAPHHGPAQNEQRVFEWTECGNGCAIHVAGLLRLKLGSRAHGQYLFPRPPHVGAGIRALRARGVLLSQLDYAMGGLDDLSIVLSRDVLVERSRFFNPTSPWTAFNFNGSQHVRVLANEFRYFFGRFEIGTFTNRVQALGNQILMDYAAQPDTTRSPHDTCCGGGMQIHSGRLLGFEGNRIAIVNDAAPGYIANNHGEMILSEAHTVSNLHQDGVVAAADADGLTDSGAEWDTDDIYPIEDDGRPNPSPALVSRHGTLKPFIRNQGAFVLIADGRGAGQIRRIVGNGRQRLQVDRPWDVIPAPGARYKVFSPAAEGVFILDNLIENGPSSVQLGDGVLGAVIVGNRSLNSGRIKLEASDLYSTDRAGFTCRHLYPPGHPLANGMTQPLYENLGDCHRHHPVADVLIADNELRNDNGKYAAAIQISVNVFQNRDDPEFAAPQTRGLTLAAVELRNNRIRAHAPRNVKEHETRALGFRFSYDWHWLGHERIYVAVGGSAQNFYSRFDRRTIDGVILEGNQIERLDATEPAHIHSHGIGALSVRDAHALPEALCLRLAPADAQPGERLEVRLIDPDRYRAQYQQSCQSQPRCNEYFLRSAVASGEVVVDGDRRLAITHPAFRFLARHWRPPAGGGMDFLHAPVAAGQRYVIEVRDRTGRLRERGTLDLAALAPDRCALLDDGVFGDGFEA